MSACNEISCPLQDTHTCICRKDSHSTHNRHQAQVSGGQVRSFSSSSRLFKNHHLHVIQAILALQASAPISSSHSPLSGNLTKAIACFRVADQCMKGVPRGLVPLTNWENMMLLEIWVASMLPSIAAHASVCSTQNNPERQHSHQLYCSSSVMVCWSCTKHVVRHLVFGSLRDVRPKGCTLVGRTITSLCVT